jgi:dienelactone hydrolase
MRTLLLLGVLVVSLPALAKPVRKPIAYDADLKLEGVLVYDDAVKAPRPGLLMVPNWLGINEANLRQAELVAAKDYVIFVADMYGKTSRPKDQGEAGKAAGAVKGDRPLMRKRIAAGLAAFLAHGKDANVDPTKVGAIGFCFGGTTVIELARSGAVVKGVVSVHGGLDAPLPMTEAPKAKILALHGADDPAVKEEDKKAWMEDLRRVKADWQLVEYGGAVHSFTDPDAKTPGRNMYDENTARRAYAAMRAFFAEVL